MCRWQLSRIVGLLLFLSDVIGDFDKRDYLKREHTLVKPYSGYSFISLRNVLIRVIFFEFILSELRF